MTQSNFLWLVCKNIAIAKRASHTVGAHTRTWFVMSVLLSISSTSGCVCRRCWIRGLGRISCLVRRGLVVERTSCTKELRRTPCNISGSPRSCLSISRWSAGKKPGLLFSKSRFSKPSTETRRAEVTKHISEQTSVVFFFALLTQTEWRRWSLC